MNRWMFILALLVTLPKPAWATCAWVVWEKDVVREMGVDRKVEWTVQSAHPRFSGCDRQAARIAAKKRLSPEYVLPFGSGQFLNRWKGFYQLLFIPEEGTGSALMMTLECYPNTIDPSKAASGH